MLTVIALGALLVCCLWVLYSVQKRRRRYLELSALVPTFKGRLPIIGHVFKLIGSERFWENVQQASIAAEEAGGVIAVWVGPTVFFFINDPDDALTVLNTCLEKSYFYKMGSNWVGEGLITADVPTWKRHRKLINPIFNQHVLDGFLGIFNQQAKLMAQDFEAEAGTGAFDPTDYLTERTIESVCQAVVGISLDDIDTKYKNAVETAFDVVAQRLSSFWLHPDIIYRFSALKQKEDEAVDTLHNMSRRFVLSVVASPSGPYGRPALTNILASILLSRVHFVMLHYLPIFVFELVRRKQKQVLYKRRKEREEARLAKTSSSRLIPFLDLLLDLAENGSFTDDEIQHELDTLIGAGHDTSARVLISTVVLLGTHQDVQEKVYQEIMTVLGSSADLYKDDMPKLVYTEAVIKEVLRISPVTPIIARDIDKEVKLKNYTLPAGSGCVVSYWGMHRLAIWGPDRMEFKPERWLDPSRLPQNPGCYGAFSLGRRNCIGKTYAVMSAKVSVVHLIRKFRITADYSKVKRKYDLLLKYVEGHHISVERRN